VLQKADIGTGVIVLIVLVGVLGGCERKSTPTAPSADTSISSPTPTPESCEAAKCVTEYFEHLNAKDYEAAYALMGPDIVSSVSYSDFAKWFELKRGIWIKSVEWCKETRDSATVIIVVTSSDDTKNGNVTRDYEEGWKLVYKDGWKLNNRLYTEAIESSTVFTPFTPTDIITPTATEVPAKVALPVLFEKLDICVSEKIEPRTPLRVALLVWVTNSGGRDAHNIRWEVRVAIEGQNVAIDYEPNLWRELNAGKRDLTTVDMTLHCSLSQARSVQERGMSVIVTILSDETHKAFNCRCFLSGSACCECVPLS